MLVICEKPSVMRDVAAAILGPGAAKARDHFTDGQVVVAASLGHALRQVKPQGYDPKWDWSHPDFHYGVLPVVPPHFRFRYEPFEERRGDSVLDTRPIVEAIRALYAAASAVVNACDAGREGEMIFWELLRHCGWGACLDPGQPGDRPCFRMWLQSMTPEGIREAWRHLEPVQGGRENRFCRLAESAFARSEADWILGMNLTMACSETIPANAVGGVAGVGVRSIGRVQTPVLAMVVARDLAIEGFEPKPFYEVRLRFDGGGGPFVAELAAPPGSRWPGGEGAGRPTRFADRAQAEAALREIQRRRAEPWAVSEKRKDFSEKPPDLFSLPSLQREMNRVDGWTAKQTLDVAQQAYEAAKALTYPRTESKFLPEDYAAEGDRIFREVLPALGGADAVGYRPSGSAQRRRLLDNSKVSDHHAIIPTGTVPPPGGDPRVERLWRVVTARFVVAFAPDATGWQVERSLTLAAATAGGGPFSAHANGKTYASLGWKAVEAALTGDPPPGADAAAADRGVAPEGGRPLAACGPQARATGGRLHEGMTRPPRRFTDELLIGAMENVDRYLKDRGPSGAPGADEGELRSAIAARGLGTSATRDKIIEVLLQRGFAERRGKEVHSTAFGRYLVRALEERGLAFLTEVETTAGWEVRLQKIERGEGGETRLRFLQDLTEAVRSAVGVFERTSLRKLRKPLGEVDAVCPRSGKRLVDYGTYYRAAGWPRLRLYKEVSGRTMRPEEYAAALAALDGKGGGEPPSFEFRSAAKGAAFRAGFRLEADRLTLSFASAGAGPSGPAGARRPTAAKDPKDGKLIEEDDGAFYLPSAPQLRCPKVLCGRRMSLEEYVALYRATVLEGKPGPRFEGFVSQRTKKAFAAALKPGQGPRSWVALAPGGRFFLSPGFLRLRGRRGGVGEGLFEPGEPDAHALVAAGVRQPAVEGRDFGEGPGRAVDVEGAGEQVREVVAAVGAPAVTLGTGLRQEVVFEPVERGVVLGLLAFVGPLRQEGRGLVQVGALGVTPAEGEIQALAGFEKEVFGPLDGQHRGVGPLEALGELAARPEVKEEG